jgi:hypothetical protein
MQKSQGPALVRLNPKGYAALHKLKLDALSWHEFGQPQDISPHVAIIRKHFQERPELGMPEIHINEYSGPAGHAVPGLAVHWLHALENASVDWSSRACWDKQCESGLNGLFRADNQTPNPVYWVYRAYAEIASSRLGTQTNSGQVAAIAGLNKARKQLTVLIGTDPLMQKNESPINIQVKNYPYSTKKVNVVLKKISAESLPSVLSTHRIKSGSVSFQIDHIVPGDAFWIEMTESPSH